MINQSILLLLMEYNENVVIAMGVVGYTISVCRGSVRVGCITGVESHGLWFVVHRFSIPNSN